MYIFALCRSALQGATIVLLFLVNACFVAGFRPGLPGSSRAQRELDHFAPFHVVLVSVLCERMFRRRLTSGAARLVPRAKGA